MSGTMITRFAICQTKERGKTLVFFAYKLGDEGFSWDIGS